jgi:hypothetical protein
MNSSDLTAEQLEQLLKAIAPARGYARSLVERMERRHFLQDDPLLVKARKVEDALHDLWVHLHYARCDRVRERSQQQAGLGETTRPDDQILPADRRSTR